MTPVPGNVESLPASFHASSLIGLGQFNLAAHRARAVGSALKADLKDGGIGNTAINGAAVAAAVGIGASKQPTIKLGVWLPLTVHETSGLPLVPGSIAGGVLSAVAVRAWCLADFTMLNRGVVHFPETFSTANDFHLTGHLDKALPGLAPDNETSPPTKSKALATHAQRAIAIQGAGIASYVAASAAQKQSKAERSKLRRNLANDSAAFMGLAATATAATVSVIGEHNPATADHIADTLGNWKLWVAASLVGVPAVKLTTQAMSNTPPAIATQVKLRSLRQRLQNKIPPVRPRLKPAYEAE